MITETELLKYQKQVMTISHKSHIQFRPVFGHYISMPSICHHLKTVPLIKLTQYLYNLYMNIFHTFTSFIYSSILCLSNNIVSNSIYAASNGRSIMNHELEKPYKKAVVS